MNVKGKSDLGKDRVSDFVYVGCTVDFVVEVNGNYIDFIVF